MIHQEHVPVVIGVHYLFVLWERTMRYRGIFDALRTDRQCAKFETEEIAKRESVADRDGVISVGGEVAMDPHPWRSCLSANRYAMRLILVILPPW